MTKELEFLLDIVKEAGDISNEKFTVKTKGGGQTNDLVTNLDVKIEKFLISKIKEKYPNFDIVGEETNAKRELTKNCFVIDPIDGTINFANGLPLWGIQVACVKNGKTIAAVINMPKIGKLFYADKTGAYLNGEQIFVKQVPIKNALYVVDGSSVLSCVKRMAAHTPAYRRFGAVCVSMAFVSAGWIHGAVFTSDKLWDYTPGMFIAKQAGASVADEKGFHAVAMNDEFLKIIKKETAKKESQSNIFVLHSLNGDTINTWGKEVESEFAGKGIKVFLPEFPIRENSSFKEFDKILSSYIKSGLLNSNSIIVCHSIGNPYFIRFAKKHNILPKAYIAVAPDAVYKYPIKRTDYIKDVVPKAYLKPDELEYAKNIKTKICFYSDEDDGNGEKFSRFITDTNAKPIYLKGYNHFDGYHRIYKIPELIDELNKLI